MRIRFVCFMLLVVGTFLAKSSTPARAQTLGVFADANGTDCDLTVPRFSPSTLYVLALLGGPAAEGIQGAEFRIDGVPPTWFATWFGPIGCDFCTNPLQGGTNVAWPSCATGTGGAVLIGTIQLFPVDLRENVYIRVRGHSMPSHPERPGPNVTLCNDPVWTVVEAGSTEFILNVWFVPPVPTDNWSRASRVGG